jgi:hypothetical protein
MKRNCLQFVRAVRHCVMRRNLEREGIREQDCTVQWEETQLWHFQLALRASIAQIQNGKGGVRLRVGTVRRIRVRFD